jgi:uncharacterized delta-60 repeat protein
MSSRTLDTSFNNPDGYLIKQFTPGKTTVSNSVAIDSSDRVIVTGYSRDTNSVQNMFITRYLANGKLDTSFAGGVIFKNYTPGKDTIGQSVAIDISGRILVAGDTNNDNSVSSMFITRYLANGTLDTTFGNGGVIFKNYTPGGNTFVNSLIIDSSDRILITGVTGVTSVTSVTNSVKNMFITRYLTNGTVDTAFSDDGVIIKNYTPRGQTEGFSVAIDSSGRVIVTGYSRGTNSVSSMFITRYLTDGTLDTTFGDGGVIFKNYTPGGNTEGFSVAIDSSDRVIVIGYTDDDNVVSSMFITRYLANGTLDTNFNSPDGVIFKNYTPGGYTFGLSIAIDSIGRILITGDTVDNIVSSMFLTRYLANGTLDPTFNNRDGVIFKNYIPGGDTGGADIAIDSSGRILVTGYTNGADKISSMFITRYLGYNNQPICLPAGTPILTDQGQVAIERIDTKLHTINNKRIVAITKTITPEKNLICFEQNSMGINCPSKRTIMTPGHEVLYRGKLVQSKHFVGRLDGVHTLPYNGKDVLYNVLQEQHGLMRVNNMVLETLHPENKVAKEILNNL